jgi:hypothetical protein
MPFLCRRFRLSTIAAWRRLAPTGRACTSQVRAAGHSMRASLPAWHDDHRQQKLSLCAQPVLHVLATEPHVPRNLAARAAVTGCGKPEQQPPCVPGGERMFTRVMLMVCSDGVLWCVPCCVLLPAGSGLDFALAGWGQMTGRWSCMRMFATSCHALVCRAVSCCACRQ